MLLQCLFIFLLITGAEVSIQTPEGSEQKLILDTKSCLYRDKGKWKIKAFESSDDN